MSELVFQQSHIESGAGCSVDVGSEWRSAEAEDKNVGGDVDDGAASTLVLPVRNDCSEVFLSIATSIWTKVRCTTITRHQQTTVVLSQPVYRSEEVARRLSMTQAPAKYLIESNHENIIVPTVAFPSPARL